MRGSAAEAGEGDITVPVAAKLLGVRPHTVYRLIEVGELGTVQTYGLTATGRPRRRRSFHLTRQDVDAFLDRARVQPGTLGHLYQPAESDR